jgi:hypothetical protein
MRYVDINKKAYAFKFNFPWYSRVPHVLTDESAILIKITEGHLKRSLKTSEMAGWHESVILCFFERLSDFSFIATIQIFLYNPRKALVDWMILDVLYNNEAGMIRIVITNSFTWSGFNAFCGNKLSLKEYDFESYSELDFNKNKVHWYSGVKIINEQNNRHVYGYYKRVCLEEESIGSYRRVS